MRLEAARVGGGLKAARWKQSKRLTPGPLPAHSRRRATRTSSTLSREMGCRRALLVPLLALQAQWCPAAAGAAAAAAGPPHILHIMADDTGWNFQSNTPFHPY